MKKTGRCQNRGHLNQMPPLHRAFLRRVSARLWVLFSAFPQGRLRTRATPRQLVRVLVHRTCPLRIDMLSDSTRDRCPSEASAHWRSTLGNSETIRSDNRSALTSSNSEWFRRKCPPADVRRLHREHQSLENQAVIGV